MRTPAFHPQAHGKVNGLSALLKTVSTQFVEQNKQNEWEKKLPKLCFAYKTAIHSTTIMAPFELMFGRIPKIPFDLVYDIRTTPELGDLI